MLHFAKVKSNVPLQLILFWGREAFEIQIKLIHSLMMNMHMFELCIHHEQESMCNVDVKFDLDSKVKVK